MKNKTNVIKIAKAGLMLTQQESTLMNSNSINTKETFHDNDFSCFQIIGASMEPSIYEGDKVVCAQILREKWGSDVQNGHIYVIKSKTDTIVKRIINKKDNALSIELHADSPAFPIQHILLSDIIEIWEIKTVVSGVID